MLSWRRVEGSYSILDPDKQLVYEVPEGSYVPSIVPGEDGDYLDFVIDLDTGQIENWKKPSVEAIRDFMSRD